MIGVEEHLILGELACQIKIFIQLKFMLMDCLSHPFFLAHGRVPLGIFTKSSMSVSDNLQNMCILIEITLFWRL